MVREAPSSFRPHWLIPGGHFQTLGGLLIPNNRYPYAADQHLVELPDGDRVVLHDDCPTGWQPGDRAALLLHGLGGCHLSAYMVRVAAKAGQRGIRVFRMDLRCCGAGWGLARLPYHGGQSDDVAAALSYVSELCPGSPIALVGFSLGGNIALKLLGEPRDDLPQQVDRAAVVSPPIDLEACVTRLERSVNRLYDLYFSWTLWRQARRHSQVSRHAVTREFSRRPRGMREFDTVFTAPICGFGTAETYYARSSSANFLTGIRIPTLVVASRDDPLVPVELFQRAAFPACVSLHLTRGGGHLGYFGRACGDADRRWLDWRVVDWMTLPAMCATAHSGVTRARSAASAAPR